jgi:hypothetical protein
LHAWFEAAFWCNVNDIFAKVESNFAIGNMLVACCIQVQAIETIKI